MNNGRAPHPGQVLVLYGPKAGVGTTVIACNLAIALRQLCSEPIILMDTHLELGSTATLMGVEPPTERTGPDSLTSQVVGHVSGVEVLARVAQPGAVLLSPQAQMRLLDLARQRARFVVVDTSSAIDEYTSALLRAATRVLLVLTPEETALRHGLSFLRYCAQHDLGDKVWAIVNRYGSASSLPGEHLERVLGARLVARLPSHGLLVLDSVNRGRPFVESHPTHPLSREIVRLAQMLIHG